MVQFPKTTAGTASELLRSVLPDADALLAHVESAGGWLGLPTHAAQLVELAGVVGHAELYESEARLLTKLWSCFASYFGVKAASTRTTVPLQSELDDAFEMVVKGFVASGKRFDDFLAITLGSPSRGRPDDDEVTPDQLLQVVRIAREWGPLAIALFYNAMALMIHGEKLTSLVEKAIAGDDESFALAVQVDRATLIGIPYFRARLERAQLLGEAAFLKNVGYRLSNPIFRGKIKYRRLWLALGLLDLLGHLDGSTSAQELLDILDSAGIERVEKRLDDEGYLRKQIREYRRAQERRRVSRQSKKI